MKIITVAETLNYTVTSYGNGWAYRFANKTDHRDVWMQDDDASLFREEWTEYENRWPDKPQNDILGALWYIYECVSRPMEIEP